MSQNAQFPWYQLIESGGELDQGDILFRCPLVQMDGAADWTSDEISATVLEADVIVMTQTCDLANDKTRNIIVCRHEAVSLLGYGKGRQKEIVSGRREREAMLEMSPFEACPMERRVVNLGEIYSLPIELARQVAATQTPRLRLLPPYREHLSQAFARFFMRVGLPQDIRID